MRGGLGLDRASALQQATRVGAERAPVVADKVGAAIAASNAASTSISTVHSPEVAGQQQQVQTRSRCSPGAVRV